MTHWDTSRIRTVKYIVALIIAFIVLCGTKSTAARRPVLAWTNDPIELGSRRELFVDDYLIDKLDGVALRLQRPHDEGTVLKFDKPWEGRFCGYATVIQDGPVFRLYYRGLPDAGSDGSAKEVSCYAESPDGIHWTKPALGLFEVKGTRENNVILADMPPYSHNFCPMLDSRKDVPPAERYKALGGTGSSGLVAFVSPDGIHWKKLRDQPVFTEGAFDSQNVPFWSEHELCYLCYFRVLCEPELRPGDRPPAALFAAHGWFRCRHRTVRGRRATDSAADVHRQRAGAQLRDLGRGRDPRGDPGGEWQAHPGLHACGVGRNHRQRHRAGGVLEDGQRREPAGRSSRPAAVRDEGCGAVFHAVPALVVQQTPIDW